MNDTRDLDDVGALWHASDPAPANLRTRVARQRIWMIVTTASEIAVMALFLSVSLAMAVRQPSLDRVVLAVAIWLFTLTAGIVSMQNRVGLWQPEGETTNAFLAIVAERARASHRAAVFGLYLWAAEVVFVIVFRWSIHRGFDPLGAVGDLVGAAVALGMLGVILVCLQRTRARVDRLELTRRQFSEVPE